MVAMKGQNTTTIHKTRQHITKHNDIQQNLLIRPVASAIILSHVTAWLWSDTRAGLGVLVCLFYFVVVSSHVLSLQPAPHPLLSLVI